MKTKILSLVSMFLIGTITVLANSKTEKFMVNGNCGMCESRIEKAALSVNGVLKVDWNKETKMIEVSFDDSKTDIHKIQMAISKSGHDTKMHKASNNVYSKLPGCCKYDRSNMKSNMNHNSGHEGHKHSGCTRSQNNSTNKSCCNK